MPTPIEKLAVVESELNRIIRGKADVIRHLLTAFVAGGNILLDDVPGVGKTTLAKALARLVDAKFSRIQFTPDLLPADITGTSIYNPSTGQFQLRPGPVFTNILLADEINRASPRTQSALLECMCEHQVSPDGQSRILEAPFMVIATQNPIEYQGTYPLPEAQLDRFAMRLTLGYPDEEAEREMLYDRRHIDPLESLKPEISCQEVLDLQADMKKVGMEASVSAYLLTIVQSTRRDARLTLGASPRAAIRLADCSRSLALISGREFVLPDDVRELAPLVLSHRLVVDAKTRYAGVSAQEIVAEIVQSVKVPL